MPRHSKETKKQLLELVRGGMMVADAAKKLGISRHTAYGWTSDTGILREVAPAVHAEAHDNNPAEPGEVQELRKKLLAATRLLETYKGIVEDFLR